MRHFLDLFDVTRDEAIALMDLAASLKAGGPAGPRPAAWGGRILGLIFEKPSLRTRVSFEAAAAHLGGNAIFLQAKDVGLGVRESVADFARVISQYVDALAVRTFAHDTVRELARHATIPVINALSDWAHPCQAMADLLTIREAKGRLGGLKLMFAGDGNNVAMSLAVACELMGLEFVLSCPEGFEFPQAFVDRFSAAFPGRAPAVEPDTAKAAAGADVVYTDVWASMGQEGEAERRRRAFASHRVDEALMARARPDAIFLHCLPAHRGEEVTEGVLEGPQSLVILQAANRLHFQKALLQWLLEAARTHPANLPPVDGLPSLGILA